MVLWTIADQTKMSIHPDHLYRVAEITQILKCSRSHLYRLLTKNEFPEPTIKKRKFVAWRGKVILEWLDNISTRR